MKINLTAKITAGAYSDDTLAQTEIAKHLAEITAPAKDKLSVADVDAIRERTASELRELGKDINRQLDMLEEQAQGREAKARRERAGEEVPAPSDVGF